MVNLYFCLGALVLFTIGFRLVKLGNPYKRGGGDSYNKRRMRRMLGWMMWATAGVMVVLSLIDQLNTDQLPQPTTAQSTPRPGSPPIHTVTNFVRITPNLLSAPALEADDSTNGKVPKAPALATGSLSLATMEPTLLNPSQDRSASASTPISDLPNKPEVEPDSAAAPTPPSVSPAPDAAAMAEQPSAIPTAIPPLNNGPAGPAQIQQLDAEVAAADAIVKKNPSNVIGYLQRGNAYGNEKHWDLARSDYEHALQLDSKCVPASFNIAELDFMQAHYDAARPGFLAIVNSTDFGDLAKYKVFLCDLFGGHEEVAAKELAVFNQVGSEASYYFANVAWSLYHKKNDDAQNWWQSAQQIFAPDKVNLYAKPLIDLGYIKVAS